MPDYEITIYGRIGPVIASCMPDFRCMAPPATVLKARVPNLRAVDDILRLLSDNHLAVMDVRVDREPTG